MDTFKAFKSPKSIVLLTVLSLLICSLYHFWYSGERNACEMTYMYEVPQYLDIPLAPDVEKQYPSYRLYLYGEGMYAESLKQGQLTGIPVLFIPGNAGSYKQVRSLGSVALRMAETLGRRYHFNYFSIDFNEELSGIYGRVLFNQAQYLMHCVTHIRKLYKIKQNREISIVMIGHSTGGSVIKALYTLPDFKPDSIGLIITLATPHASPVIPFDSDIVKFQSMIDDYWFEKRANLTNLCLISIGGGFRDKLVPSYLTKLDSKWDLSVISSSIPDVWASTDHLCIVWCRQLVVKLNRMLFDLIEEEGYKITEDSNKMRRTIRYHLIERTRSKLTSKIVIPPQFSIDFPEQGEWIEEKTRLTRIIKQKVLKPLYILLPLIKKETLVVRTEGVSKLDWVSVCNASKINDKLSCDSGINLLTGNKLLPNRMNEAEQRLYRSSAAPLLGLGYSHLLISVSPSPNSVSILAERFTFSRVKSIILPSAPQSVLMLMSWVEILDVPISEQSTYYNLSLVGLDRIWQVYGVQVQTTSCYPTASQDSIIEFLVPWNKEERHKLLEPKKGSIIYFLVKLIAPKPKDYPSDRHPVLQLYLDPDCGYSVKLKVLFLESVSQFLYHFGPHLLPWAAALIVSMIASQLEATRHKKPSPFSIATDSDMTDQQIPYFYYFSPTYLILYEMPSILMYGLVYTIPLILMIMLRISSSEEEHGPLMVAFENVMKFSGITSTYWQNSLTLVELATFYAVFLVILIPSIYFFTLVLIWMYAVVYWLRIFFSLRVLGGLKSVFVNGSQQRTSQGQASNVSSKSSSSSRQAASTQRTKDFTFPNEQFSIVKALVCLSFILIGSIYASGLPLIASLIFHQFNLINLTFKCWGMEERKGLSIQSTIWALHLNLLCLLVMMCIPIIPELVTWLKLGLPAFIWDLTLNSEHYVSSLLTSISFGILWQTPIYSSINPESSLNNVLVPILRVSAILMIIYGAGNFSVVTLIGSTVLTSIAIFYILIHMRFRHLKCD